MTLQKLQIFRDLTEEEMQKSLVCSQAVTRTYQKNEYIFRQEDRPQKLYFILEGEVEVGSINLMIILIHFFSEKLKHIKDHLTVMHTVTLTSSSKEVL